MTLLGTTPAAAQSVDEGLRRDIESLKQGQAEIRKELRELKDLLGTRLSPRPASAIPENLERFSGGVERLERPLRLVAGAVLVLACVHDTAIYWVL